MTEEEARRLLLVRAVETTEETRSVLTREDRQQASAHALSEVGALDSRRGGRDEAFLIRRSEYAFKRLAERDRDLARYAARVRWPSWVTWLLPATALVLGLATNELDDTRRINIISFPLLGMLAWNLAVFAWLAVGGSRRLIRGERAAPPNVLVLAVQRMGRWVQTGGEGRSQSNTPLERFAKAWLQYASRLNYSRASLALHLSAAAFASGVLIGMLLRGVSANYSPGWDSSYDFVNADTLRRVIEIVLGPASAITGIELPTVQELAAMKGPLVARNPGSADPSGGNWLILYSVTALVFIIAPRLALAGWHAAWTVRLSRRFPAPGSEDLYIRQLLRSGRGGGGQVRVIPYGHHPSESARRRLEQLLTQVLGDGTRILIDTPVEYGDEDEWLTQAILSPELDHVVVLFNLASTPEAENHGAFVAGVGRRLEALKAGIALSVMLDETSYRQRMSGQVRGETRVDERRAAWVGLLDRLAIQPTTFDSNEADSPALIERLEGALMKTPSLLTGRGR